MAIVLHYFNSFNANMNCSCQFSPGTCLLLYCTSPICLPQTLVHVRYDTTLSSPSILIPLSSFDLAHLFHLYSTFRPNPFPPLPTTLKSFISGLSGSLSVARHFLRRAFWGIPRHNFSVLPFCKCFPGGCESVVLYSSGAPPNTCRAPSVRFLSIRPLTVTLLRL